MGTKTSVGTTISRVVGDGNLPGAIKTGLTKAILSDGNLVDYVLEELVTGIGMKAQRMYDYAKSGAYVYGLPSGQFTTGADGLDQVTAVLESIEGAPVTIMYSHYGPANSLHVGWMALMASHGYNPATNQLGVLTAVKGTPVWLENMVVVIPSNDGTKLELTTLAQWGFAAKAGYTPQRDTLTDAARALIKPSPVQFNVASPNEHLLVTYGWMVGTVYTTATLTIPVAGFVPGADYFHVRYLVGGLVKYWMYRDGDGAFPALDAVYDREQEPNGSFFPFTYFRYQKHSENSDKTTQAYKTSKKLVSYLGMNYDQVADGVNANPNIGDVEQAMMMMVIPANTTNHLEQRYLWLFFNAMFLASAPGTKFSSETAAQIAQRQQVDSTQLTPGIVVQDARFKMSIENDGVYKRRVAGSIGPVGSYASSYSVLTRTIEAEVIDQSESGEVRYMSTVTLPTKSHFYQRQVSTGFYEEVQVVGMRTRFFIIDGYTTLGDEEDSILIIPLDHAITRNFSVPDREMIYARSLHYVFNSVVVTHTKWYQTGLFAAILVIVAVVVAFYDGGSTLNVMLGLLAAAEYTAATILILTSLIEALILKEVFKLFVKAIGVNATFVIAILALVGSAGMSIDSGSLNGAPWAADLLKLSSGLVNAIGNQLQSNYMDLLDQAKEFSLFEEAQNKLLDDAKALLEGNNHLDPFVIFGESPQDFYNRTVHSSNIGVISVGAISSFVDNALTLPKLNDTLGEYI